MFRRSFNEDWTFGRKQGLFAALAGGSDKTSITLPHDAMRLRDRDPNAANGSHTGYFPGGEVEYEKTFDVPAEWRDRSVTIEFEGIYRDAMVFVNGDFVTQRPNGYTTFTAQLDPYLRFGSRNTIRVEARSHEDSRWYSGTGIHRDVWLMVSDPVHITVDGIRVTTPQVDAEVAVVSAAITVENETRHTRTVTVATTMLTPDQSIAATSSAPLTLLPGTSGTVHLRHYDTDPDLWNVDSPNIYTMQCQVKDGSTVLDEGQANFGIRTLAIDPLRGLQINGVPTKLRGGCIHHDNGPLGSAAIARAEYRRIEILKDAGYNAVRSAHNPMSRALLDACDRIGMLVIDEISDVWTEGKTSFDYSLAFPEWWERDVTAMVSKDFNHPSVIMYSIGNEIFEVGKPIGSTWGRALAEHVRQLDPSRLVTNAINGLVANLDLVAEATSQGESDEPGDVNTMIAVMGDMMNQFGASEPVSQRTEEAHSQLDTSGINYSEARYVVDSERHPDRISYGSETFPGALDRLWELVEKYPQVIGDFAWTAWDYLGESGVGRAVYADDPLQPTGITSPYPWLVGDCGTIDITGFRRPISYWRETIWGLRDEPYIAVHRPQNHTRSLSVGPWAWDDVVSSWSWDTPEGSPIVVDVYTNADEVELFLDGVSIGRAPVGAEKSCIARLTTEYRPGELTAISYRHNAETGRTSLQSASSQHLLAARAERSEITADTTDLAYVEVSIRDDAGILVNDVTAEITVTVEGPAELAGFASAQPDSEEALHASTRTTYDGRALAILRPTGPGPITLTATAEGLQQTQIHIEAVATS